MNRVFKLFKPAALKEELQDQALIAKKYKYWRIRIFYSMYIGYVFFYFARKSFTFIIPQLVELGYSYSDLGLLGTILSISYGISKFFSGILSDRANPRYFMAVGLMLTGVFNILFGCSNCLWLFAIFWFLNGWFQGWGWPPITKQLTYWYTKEERGLWWSICSTSHNIGGAVIPIVAGYYAQSMGWRYAMFMPGIMCIIVGFLLINRLRDEPRSLGLPPIEKYKSDNSEYELPSISPTTSLSTRQILIEHIFNNKSVIIMAVSYFFIYVVKTAINDWTVPFLVSVRGYNLLIAGTSIFWFEIGGLLGMLFSGWMTDRVFVGKRTSFIMVCSICLACCLWIFWQVNNSGRLVDFLLISLIGFFVYGPQMLIGLAAAEYVDKKAACSANGFVSWWGYVGAAVAGYPIGLLINYSWNWYFIILLFCSVLASMALMPLVLTKPYKLAEQS
jgi:MFS transporter, OPA family, sugar phosphate sensor protein UhpC